VHKNLSPNQAENASIGFGLRIGGDFYAGDLILRISKFRERYCWI